MNIISVQQVGSRSFEIRHGDGLAIVEAGTAFWAEDDRNYDEPSQLADGQVIRDFGRARSDTPVHSIAMMN
jgi:hypothetical protein